MVSDTLFVCISQSLYLNLFVTKILHWMLRHSTHTCSDFMTVSFVGLSPTRSAGYTDVHMYTLFNKWKTDLRVTIRKICVYVCVAIDLKSGYSQEQYRHKMNRVILFTPKLHTHFIIVRTDLGVIVLLDLSVICEMCVCEVSRVIPTPPRFGE